MHKPLDFTRRFLPEALARAERLAFLSPVERLTLNHLRGRGYLCLIDQLESVFFGSSPDRPHAGELGLEVLPFAEFREEFDRGFGSPCASTRLPSEAMTLRPHPLVRLLGAAHLAGTAERHFGEWRRDPGPLDLRFRALIEHRFLRRAAPDLVDMRIASLVRSSSLAERQRGVDDFFAGVQAFEESLWHQVSLDLESLSLAIGRELTDDEKTRFRAVQLPANRWTFLGSGLGHPDFLSLAVCLGPGVQERLQATAGMLA